MGPSGHQCSLQSYQGQPRASRKRHGLRMRILRGSTPASLSIGEIITGSNLPERRVSQAGLVVGRAVVLASTRWADHADLERDNMVANGIRARRRSDGAQEEA